MADAPAKTSPAASSPFLRGNWAPLHDGDTPEAGLPAHVSAGTLPADLRGSFLRVGPSPSPSMLRRPGFDARTCVAYRACCARRASSKFAVKRHRERWRKAVPAS